MSNVPTITLALSLPASTHDLLLRYAAASGGNLGNTASALIMDGLDASSILHPVKAVQIGLPPVHPMSTVGRIIAKTKETDQ